MSQYVALLRGINVGGKNIIKMAALSECFASQGFRDIATYIQSGNVVFSAAGGPAELIRRIEAALATTFSYQASVMLRSRKQMQDVVGRAPAGFGTQPAKYRYDVLFLKPDVTAAAALKLVPTRPGVDEAHAGTGVVYFSRLIAKATQSRLGKVASMPIYQSMTIRNWNTTTALLRLMDAPAGRGARR
jgi:uncharacterized protein (DUF1697 family)